MSSGKVDRQRLARRFPWRQKFVTTLMIQLTYCLGEPLFFLKIPAESSVTTKPIGKTSANVRATSTAGLASRDQPGGLADLHGLGAALCSELIKQAARMGLHRVFADE